MLTMCFGPSLIGSFAGTLLAVLIGSLAVIFTKQPKELDPEREWKLLRMRVSGHPWKARAYRWFGVD